jgi:poly(beta-D-mannuronate) lyase
MNIRIIATIILLLSPHNFAKEFRVSTPAELGSAFATVKPGDTITILSGTYSNWNISFIANGSATSPILLRAETTGGVTLTGTSSMKIGGAYLVVDGFTFTNGYIASGGVVEFRSSGTNYANHCRLTNTTIVNYSNPDSSVDTKWISIYGQYNRVDHCSLKGKSNLGTTLVVWRPDTLANYAQIDSNYFGYRPDLNLNGAETIRIGTGENALSSSYSAVTNNYFEECDGEMEIVSNKSCNNTYSYNTFVNCKGTLTLRNGNNCSVFGNFFFGNNVDNSGGIRIIGEDHRVYNNYLTGLTGNDTKSAITLMNGTPTTASTVYNQVNRAVIAFNTIVDNTADISIGVIADKTATLPPLDCTIANNIIVGSSAPLVTLTTTPANMTWKGNIFYGASSGFTTIPDSNYIADPKLLAADETGVRHISSASPVVDAALETYDFALTDMDGQPRGTKKDIGADEYSLASRTVAPMKRSDVGPRTGTSSVHDSHSEIASGFELLQNYPNPFNPSTTICFTITNGSGLVRLKIVDILGREVAQLVNKELPAGTYTERFTPQNPASGVYYSVLEYNGSVKSKKLLLLK